MRGKENKILVVGLFLALFILSFVSSAEVPTGPDEIDVLAICNLHGDGTSKFTVEDK